MATERQSAETSPPTYRVWRDGAPHPRLHAPHMDSCDESTPSECQDGGGGSRGGSKGPDACPRPGWSCVGVRDCGPAPGARRVREGLSPGARRVREGLSPARPWIIITLVLLLFLQQTLAIKWLAIANGKQRVWNKTKHCSQKRTLGLIKPQVQICKRNLELMPVVAHASRETFDVCQEMFTDSRWNCSSIRQAPGFMADLTGGSREQALVYALASAALTQATAKACSVGATTKCSCGRLPNEEPAEDFKWGGCGDDVRFGLIFSQSFVDISNSGRKKPSRSSLMNIHNNEVGRKIVQSSLTTACKCHGVSGSCSIKTCWMALPDMRTVGSLLYRRYAVAVEVKRKRIGDKSAGKARASKLVPLGSRRKFSDEDLVYYTKSPDYCYPDPALGSMGTHQRECKKDEPGSGGCQSMCCGRGFTSEVVEVRHRCDCKYYWCCYVKCKTCTKKVEIHRCR